MLELPFSKNKMQVIKIYARKKLYQTDLILSELVETLFYLEEKMFRQVNDLRQFTKYFY